MKNTAFIYDISGINAGDANSCPLDYFDFNFTNNTRIACKKVRDINTLSEFYEDKDNIIFGGGGIITGRVKKALLLAGSNKDKKYKLFSWGIGYNEKGIRLIDYNTVKSFLDNFDLHGIRDWGNPYNYVPCSSCMNTLFDCVKNPVHEIVIYNHYGHLVPNPKKYPQIMNNEMSLEKIIDFLSSGKVIITSAYHGAYWGMLLNRKVIVIPNASRFFGFRYPPIYRTNENWGTGLDETKGQSFEGYLSECRKINQLYYEEVKKIMNK